MPSEDTCLFERCNVHKSVCTNPSNSPMAKPSSNVSHPSPLSMSSSPDISMVHQRSGKFLRPRAKQDAKSKLDFL